MNIPPKTDPRWRALVVSQHEFQFKVLATKIAFNRIKRVAGQGGEASIQQAIELCHEYFTKNEKIAAGDLELALG
nr:hypothetical protein [uncultured Holophaga sp.]